MRLLVCFKVTRDLDSVTSLEWREADSGEMDVSYAKKIINIFDEAALETALCLRDQLAERDIPVYLTALTISGGEDISSFVKNLFALKFNEIVQIPWEGDIRFRPDFPARLIAAYAKSCPEPFDFILTGSQASVGDNKQTPLLLAEWMGWPCVNQVMDIQPVGGRLKVRNQIDGGQKDQLVEGPAILAMGNALHAYLRLSTLREKMAAAKRDCTVILPEELGIDLSDQSGLRLEKLYYPRQQREGVILEGAGEEEKARILYERYMKEVLHR